MPYRAAPDGGGVLFLNGAESRLLEEALALLDAENPGEAEIVKQRFDCLKVFGKAIALYPSIRESQILRGYVRDERQLIKALVGLAPSAHLLRIPARIQAVRSFLVTKFHGFALLSKLFDPGERIHEEVREVLFSIMFTIMAEDVYFSCLDDSACPEGIKIRLADELVSLWDSGAEPAMIRHFHALESLWVARNASPPGFGTMDGASELVRLSFDMEDDWRDFLVNHVNSEGTRWALEEFLFGLSYEEICSVRSKLKDSKINAVDFDEIRSCLGSAPAYTVMDNSDPRLVHDFYMDRKEAALFRQRLGTAGPRKTLEEIYLTYRMTL